MRVTPRMNFLAKARRKGLRVCPFMAVYRKRARGIQGPRFRPKPSQLWGLRGPSETEFRAIIRVGNYVSDSSQPTLKKETSRVKPHALEEDTGRERAPKHVASPSMSHFSGSSEGHPERNFERGQGSKSRIGWPSNDPKFETF